MVLSRKELQRIILSNGVTLTVLKIQGMRDGMPIQPRVRIGIEAPDDVSIWREEVYLANQGRAPGPESPTQ